jgi:chromate reductase
MTIHVLGITGSLRRASTNKGMLRYAKEHAPEGMTIEIADLSDVPFFNADVTEKNAAVQTLLAQMEKADAFIFGCNEYNYSLAPALKNALDWASREPDNRLLAGKTASIMGAAGGMGSSRAQYHLRQVCVYLNLHLVQQPEVFANAFAGGFNENGDLTDAHIQANIDKQLAALKALTEKLR